MYSRYSDNFVCSCSETSGSTRVIVKGFVIAGVKILFQI